MLDIVFFSAPLNAIHLVYLAGFIMDPATVERTRIMTSNIFNLAGFIMDPATVERTRFTISTIF